MWTYQQSTGELHHDGQLASNQGYSGHGPGKNNPALEDQHNVGPIPRGRWRIETPTFDSQTHGLICMRLHACEGTVTFGRDGFLIHGDSPAHPGMASEGCVILPRSVRIAIAASQDADLMVIG